MVYVHYVVMGGFAARVKEMHNVRKMVTFSPNGIFYLSSVKSGSVASIELILRTRGKQTCSLKGSYAFELYGSSFNSY
jgi:hypothetical protein